MQLPKLKRRKPVEDQADQGIDDALKRLADATAENEEVCAKVKRRQSSSKLRLVSLPPDAPVPTDAG